MGLSDGGILLTEVLSSQMNLGFVMLEKKTITYQASFPRGWTMAWKLEKPLLP